MNDVHQLVNEYIAQLSTEQRDDAWHSLVEIGSDALPTPACPDCRTLMVARGDVAGGLGIGILNFTSTLYQCPKCKTVTVGAPDEE